MTFNLSGSVLIPSFAMIWPKYFTSAFAKVHFEGFNLLFASLNGLKTSAKCYM